LKRKQRFERFNRPIQQRDPSVGRFTRLQAELIKKEKKPKGRKKKVPVAAKKKKTEEEVPKPEPESAIEEEKEIKPEVEKKIKKPKAAPAQPLTATAASSRPRRSIGNYSANNHKDEEEQKEPEPKEDLIVPDETDMIKSETDPEESITTVETVDSQEVVDEKAARDLVTIKELMTEMLDRVEKAVVVISKAEELNLSVDDAKNQLTTSGSGSCSRKRKRKSDAPTRCQFHQHFLSSFYARGSTKE
jgi:hypothetical protein